MVLLVFGCSATTTTDTIYKNVDIQQIEAELLSMVNDKYPSLSLILKAHVEILIKDQQIGLLSEEAQNLVNRYIAINQLDSRLLTQEGQIYPKINDTDSGTLKDMEKEGKLKLLSIISQDLWNIFKIKDPYLSSGITALEALDLRLINIYNEGYQLYEVNTNDLESIKILSDNKNLKLLDEKALIVANYNINLDKPLKENSMTRDNIRDLYNTLVDISNGIVSIVKVQDYNLLKNLQTDNLNLLNIFGDTLFGIAEEHLNAMDTQVNNISIFIHDNQLNIIGDSNLEAELISKLYRSDKIVNTSNFPLFQNLQIGTKCISVNGSIVECNPRDDNQLWIMDINGKIVNAQDTNKCITIASGNSVYMYDCTYKDNNLGNTCIIETITTGDITKRYLKNTKFGQYLDIDSSSNKLITSSNVGNNNINKLIQLTDPIWSIADLEEYKDILLTILDKEHKAIDRRFTYADIDNMERRIVINYIDKPYPLLTEQETLLLQVLVNDQKLYLLKDQPYTIVDKYFKAKKQVNEIETFVINNKNGILIGEPQTIKNLLDIAGKGAFGININQPIYSSFTMGSDASKCIAGTGSSLKIQKCNSSSIQKWVLDPFGAIRNYKEQDKCWETSPITQGGYTGKLNFYGIVKFMKCVSDDIKQTFVQGTDNQGRIILTGYNGSLRVYLASFLNLNEPIINMNSSKYTINQDFHNFRVDNSSMFWLLKPETRKILADVLEREHAK